MSDLYDSIKIMNTKPDLTEEDVRQSMNFDRVLAMVNEKHVDRQKTVQRIKLFVFVVGVVSIAGLGYYQYWVNKTRSDIQPKSEVLPTVTEQPKPKKQPKKVDIAGSRKKSELSTENRKGHPENAHDEKPVVTTAQYVAAEPLNGFPGLYNYFDMELKYPKEAIADSVRGVVTVKFIIDETGQPRQFTILNSLNAACDREALRVIEKMPVWKPATMDGKPVSSKITIPLTFSLQTTRK